MATIVDTETDETRLLEDPSMGEVPEKLLVDSQDRELVFMGENAASIKTRELYLLDEIEQGSYMRWFQALNVINRTPGPIKFYINSPGGEVDLMLSMYDLMRGSTNPIYTIGTGSVCSAAALLLACGHKRFVTEHCTVMSHQSSVELEGRFDEVESRFKWTKWTEQVWPELMARHTPWDITYWKRLTKREAESWFLGGAAVVEKGLADHVISGPVDKFVNRFIKK